MNEEEWNSRYVQDEGEYSRLWTAISDELGIRITQDRIPVPDYVELVAPLHDDRYRLINRQVERGFVAINKNERYELLRERIRVLLRRDLPHRVPKEICESACAESSGDQEGVPGTDAAAVRKGGGKRISPLHAGADYRACGGSKPHARRPFLAHGIPPQYRSGHGGDRRTLSPGPGLRYREDDVPGRAYHGARGVDTRYTTPACAAMQTTGLCVHRDPLCEKVSHPLSYYKVKKSRPLKPAPAKPQGADKPVKNS